MRALRYGGLAILLLVSGALADQTATFQQGVNSYAGTVNSEIAAGSPYNTMVNGYSNGSHTIWVDYPNGTGQQAGSDILLRFDGIVGNGAGQVPAGATVVSASLSLTTTTNYAGSGNGGELHRILRNWTATDTWNSLDNGITADGVDAEVGYNAQVGDASLVVVDGLQVMSVTTDVQAWVNGTTNYGWAILPWVGGQDGWGIWDSTYGTVSARPLLAVTYAVPEPGTAMLVLGGAGWWVARRGRRGRSGRAWRRWGVSPVWRDEPRATARSFVG